MADPIKTTVQEALDHIKDWVTKGEKDKAVRGLQELLNFDPGNLDARKMLTELQGGSTVAPVTPVAPAPVSAAKLDMELKPTTPSMPTLPSIPPAPATPIAPAPEVTIPVPAPIPPKPVTPATPIAPVTPVVPPIPVTPKAPVVTPTAPRPSAPTITPNSPKPSATPISPLRPLSMPPEVLTKEIENGQAESSVLNKVQGLSQNTKWAIFVGVLVVAVIGGFFFYKTFLSASQPLSSDIQLQVENSDNTFVAPIDNALPNSDVPVAPIDVLSSSDSLTDDTSVSSDTSASGVTTTPGSSTDLPATSSEENGGKVKRR